MHKKLPQNVLCIVLFNAIQDLIHAGQKQLNPVILLSAGVIPNLLIIQTGSDRRAVLQSQDTGREFKHAALVLY